jgi:hypothetical protein
MEHDGRLAVSEEAKAEAALDFFESILATPPSRAHIIKLDRLDLHCMDLSDICEHFTEEEVWSVIKALPLDKAPGPDRFSTRFLQVTWPVICHDLMLAFDSFWHLDTRNLQFVNEALLTLLLKSPDASKVVTIVPSL